MFFFDEENDLAKLWVPDDARVLTDMAWVDDNFPEKSRLELVIVEAENVLEPSVLQEVTSFCHTLVTSFRHTLPTSI